MISEKRKDFLKSIRQDNNETEAANTFLSAKLQSTKEEDKQRTFIQIPKDIENIDYANVFLNAKVQTEMYNREKYKKEER